ncbi:DUF924 family protein [Cohaesibacter intestini]|uniref:DUF924 family protein n=1 Tax=Cohaesibacter intestini TaxID=2211145 RepID=UPI000DEAF13F|nr:DUF924 family protein [Cohaesibacter intestini]
MQANHVQPQEVLDFWFGADPKYWFAKDDGFDAEIRERFGPVLEAARAGQLSAWRESLHGTLALIIVLDQFSRNLYRDSAEAFAHDDEALRLSSTLVAHPDWNQLSYDEKTFAVMPMMHAEDLQVQEDCIAWMKRIGNANSERFAIIHRDIIARFGRFPHRNAVLGRETTPEEQVFLDEGGFAG